MTKEFLSTIKLPVLAVTAGATTPDPGMTYALCMNTSGFLMFWDGTSWEYASPAGGSGSPGGATGEVQYNNAGAFAGAANVEIASGFLDLIDDGTNPAKGAANHLKVYSHAPAGREMLAIQPALGGHTMLQPTYAKQKIAHWSPFGNATTMSAVGANTLTATGTATTHSVAVTNHYTMARKVEYLVTAAANNAVAGWRQTLVQWAIGHATLADLGGFHYVCRWGPATGVATATTRAFVGMGNATAAPTDVEPSTITHIVGMGWDAADTNIQIMHRGAGAITKIDLGASFPVPTADRTKVYELEMFSPPGTTQAVYYQVKDVATGAEVSGLIVTNLPPTTTLLCPRGWMSVGGTSSVIGIALINLYIESDN